MVFSRQKGWSGGSKWNLLKLMGGMAGIGKRASSPYHCGIFSYTRWSNLSFNFLYREISYALIQTLRGRKGGAYLHGYEIILESVCMFHGMFWRACFSGSPYVLVMHLGVLCHYDTLFFYFVLTGQYAFRNNLSLTDWTLLCPAHLSDDQANFLDPYSPDCYSWAT